MFKMAFGGIGSEFRWIAQNSSCLVADTININFYIFYNTPTRSPLCIENKNKFKNSRNAINNNTNKYTYINTETKY